VTVIPYSSCGSCAACRRERRHACCNNETYGVQRDGVLAPFIVVPAEKVVPAEGLSPAAAALIEPLSVGCHAAKRGEAGEGDVVAVFGCGAVGLGAVTAAVSRGARKVIAVDIDDGKLDVARAVGATDVINAAGNDLGSSLAKASGAAGPDLIVEASGAPSAYQAALEHVSFTGRVSCVSYASAPVELNTSLFVKKELDFRGSRNAEASDFDDMAAALKSGFPVERVVTRSVPFDEAGKALMEWAARPAVVTKIQVTFPEV
jgi:threonine dehydrogenase-like Zn-dependent dehydrogenase